MIDSSTRVLRAVSYIEFALRNIDKKTYISAWCRNCAIYSMKNARTLLKNIKNEDKKERESVRLLKRLQELNNPTCSCKHKFDEHHLPGNDPARNLECDYCDCIKFDGDD